MSEDYYFSLHCSNVPPQDDHDKKYEDELKCDKDLWFIHFLCYFKLICISVVKLEHFTRTKGRVSLVNRSGLFLTGKTQPRKNSRQIYAKKLKVLESSPNFSQKNLHIFRFFYYQGPMYEAEVRFSNIFYENLEKKPILFWQNVVAIGKKLKAFWQKIIIPRKNQCLSYQVEEVIFISRFG